LPTEEEAAGSSPMPEGDGSSRPIGGDRDDAEEEGNPGGGGGEALSEAWRGDESDALSDVDDDDDEDGDVDESNPGTVGSA